MIAKLSKSDRVRYRLRPFANPPKERSVMNKIRKLMGLGAGSITIGRAIDSAKQTSFRMWYRTALSFGG